MTLLNDYFKRIQEVLTAEGRAAMSFRHGLNRGLIREAFIRQFLSNNLPGMWRVGTGEIINRLSQTGDHPRPQIDAVLHDNRRPHLPLAGEMDLFFVESVSTTIEVKSHLEKEDLVKSGRAAAHIKKMAIESFQERSRLRTHNERLPFPYAFIFAYDGPKNISTVLNWVNQLASEPDSDDGLFTLANASLGDRSGRNHKFVDGIFVLNRGFVVIDSMAHAIQADGVFDRSAPPSQVPIAYYGFSQELYLLWLLINAAITLRLGGEDILIDYVEAIDIFFDPEDIDKLIVCANDADVVGGSGDHRDHGATI